MIGVRGLAAAVVAVGFWLPGVEAVADPGGVVEAPVVIVGIGGLTWDNLSEDGSPTLWRMLQDGADAAAMTVRTVHSPPCPLDGWLSLSAGRAATDPQSDRNRDCTTMPAVTGGVVDGWAGLVSAQQASVFDPDLGLLGQTLAAGNVCATAVGPGAALALADREGKVTTYHSELAGARWDCPVTVVDAGVVDRRSDPGKALRQADRTVQLVLDRAPRDATVIVLGISQPLHSTVAMGAVVMSGPQADHRYLTAQSTRWQGIGSLSAGPHLWLVGALLLYLIAVVLARRLLAPAWFEAAVARWPYLWGCYLAVVAIAVIGSTTNDYGLRVALLTVGIAGPPLALTVSQLQRVISSPGLTVGLTEAQAD